MADAAVVTVAIPLHRGRRWAGNVVANIARLRGHARILVSDAHEHDDALRTVRERCADGDDLVVVGRRDLPPGWVPHYNDLMRRVRTPLMMWLPQDDEIGADWVTGGARVLRDTPDALIATGVIHAVDEDGCERAGLTITGSPLLEHADRDTRVSAATEFLVRDWGPIGLPFRGVFRRERAFPLHEARAGGEWADLLWLLGMAARGPFATTPGAVYGKRFHPTSEHVWWSSFARSPDAARLTIDALRAALDGDDLAAVRSAWTGDRTALIRLLTDAERHASHLGDAVAERDARIAALARDLEQAHTGSAELRRALKREALARAESQRAAADTRTALAALLGSRSWRLTAPLRGLANRARARKGR